MYLSEIRLQPYFEGDVAHNSMFSGNTINRIPRAIYAQAICVITLKNRLYEN